MSERLQQLQDSTLAQIGQLMANNPPNEQMLDQAIKQGLDILLAVLPSVEATATITVADRTQNINTLLADVQRVNWIIYPYDEEQTHHISCHYVLSEPNKAIISKLPAAGDKIRVGYRRRYTVADLDGQTQTTLPEAYDRALTLAAAGELLRIYAMQLTIENAKKNAKSTDNLMVVSIQLIDMAKAAAYELAPRNNPVWSEIGL